MRFTSAQMINSICNHPDFVSVRGCPTAPRNTSWNPILYIIYGDIFCRCYYYRYNTQYHTTTILYVAAKKRTVIQFCFWQGGLLCDRNCSGKSVFVNQIHNFSQKGIMLFSLNRLLFTAYGATVR